jgi:hypothetical protein
MACAPWWEPAGRGSNPGTHRTPAQGWGWGINPSSRKKKILHSKRKHADYTFFVSQGHYSGVPQLRLQYTS